MAKMENGKTEVNTKDVSKILEQGSAEKISDEQVKTLDKLSRSNLQDETLAELSKVWEKVQLKLGSYMNRSKNEKSKDYMMRLFNKVSSKIQEYQQKMDSQVQQTPATPNAQTQTPPNVEGGGCEGGICPATKPGDEIDANKGPGSEIRREVSPNPAPQAPCEGDVNVGGGTGAGEAIPNKTNTVEFTDEQQKSILAAVDKINNPDNGEKIGITYAELFKGNEELATMLINKGAQTNRNGVKLTNEGTKMDGLLKNTRPKIDNAHIDDNKLCFNLAPTMGDHPTAKEFEFKLSLNEITEQGEFSKELFKEKLADNIAQNKDQIKLALEGKLNNQKASAQVTMVGEGEAV